MLTSNGPDTLIDAHKRHINYLRISITDRCNLRCAYCSPHLPVRKMPHESILRYEEILRIAQIGAQMGITKVRVTGGEPFVRKGCTDFLAQLTQMPQLKDISLTTNGVLLNRHLDRLFDMGIRRLNISLDTLDRAKYRQITGADVFDRVWENIRLAMKRGFTPIKVNAVALNGVNDDELEDLARLTLPYPIHVRFIEHMPFGGIRPCNDRPLLAPDIKDRIEAIAPLQPVAREDADGPARRYRFPEAAGEIGFITAVSEHFCGECNRLRLTADGRLRTCLLSEKTTDIKTALRTGASDEALARLILQAVSKKPGRHDLLSNNSCRQDRMISIGG